MSSSDGASVGKIRHTPFEVPDAKFVMDVPFIPTTVSEARTAFVFQSHDSGTALV
jgi:hypothetical protein